MVFDIHVHIDSQSLEGHVLESIVNRENVSPEEAILTGLRHPALAQRTPAEDMIGAFSRPEDAAAIDDAMQYVRELRATDQLRDFEL